MSNFLDAIPKLAQRQDSTVDQLKDLRLVANKLGMYDAADVITRYLGNQFDAADAIPTNVNKHGYKSFGCHFDLEPGQIPDACVIDLGRPHECINAKSITCKEQCSYWREVITS
jgi:hypothetical protein